jgi:cytochrome c-type protein NapB
MKKLLAPVLAAIFAGSLVVTTGLMAETKLLLRGDTPLTTEAAPPPIAPLKNNLEREPRNYPEQPPLIPHSTDGYAIDLNSNKCLSCHARSRTPESKAPMVSITHFMDRDGQFLATISPRRYFCTQCHVPQAEVKAPVKNTFVDIDEVLGKPNGGAK